MLLRIQQRAYSAFQFGPLFQGVRDVLDERKENFADARRQQQTLLIRLVVNS